MCIFMNFKINKFVSDAELVAVYTYNICDSYGNILRRPTFEFLENLNLISKLDAEILVSQIEDTVNVYGINGRNENSSGREGLFALPSKYEEGVGKIDCRYRLFYWVISINTIVIGGGCFKPEFIGTKHIKAYQDVPECETVADELCKVSKFLENLSTKKGIIIDEIDYNEIFEL